MKDIRPEELKRRLRQLKTLEEKLRFGGHRPAGARLVWDSFFDLHETYRGHAKYSLGQLAAMGRDAYKAAVDEYFAYIYYEIYKDTGFEGAGSCYDPALLAKLGLPPDAGAGEIKHRFRVLAKQYHPDTGGDAGKFIELMETYRRLIEK